MWSIIFTYWLGGSFAFWDCKSLSLLLQTEKEKEKKSGELYTLLMDDENGNLFYFAYARVERAQLLHKKRLHKPIWLCNLEKISKKGEKV